MPELRRTLTLPALIFTGIIMIQPTAPMPLFGVVHEAARGHVVTCILIALCGMVLTALSYGKMAALYPQAGSAYSYVGKEVHPIMGFAAGWSMLMDYVLNPVICTIWCGKAMANFFPQIPDKLWGLFFAGLFTLLNLRNIQATARTNQILTFLMGLVIVAMLVASGNYYLAHPVSLSEPFYNPKYFSLASISAGTSLAVLTYIGFDGISTLSEEVIDARRNILRGIVLVCLIIGVLSAVEAYAAQIVWPYGEKLPDIDTAYVHIAGRAGGPLLFAIVNLTLIAATVGSGSGGVLAGARLMYGMGKENSLPASFFGYIDPVSGIPSRNVLFIGACAALGGLLLTYEMGANLLNFGAFVGFMGVNLSCLLRYGVREKRPLALLLPALGFLICAYLWWSLAPMAKLYGGIWLAIGIAYHLYTRRLKRAETL